MEFFTIRLKRFPDKFVGKQNPTYALRSDLEMTRLVNRGNFKNLDDSLQVDAHWFVPQQRAKVWTSKTDLRKFIGRCKETSTDTFSEFEFLCNGLVIPFEEIYQNALGEVI